MTRAALIVSCLAACGSDENLDSSIGCKDGICPAGFTCLVDRCVEDGSLDEGETCRHEQQCGPALTCQDLVCVPGCSELYQLDDCPTGSWCNPAGECVPSECDPVTTELCDAGHACVAFAADVGGCLPYCEYGFASGSYRDACAEEPQACHPLGLNQVPICLPSGEESIGDPGCHVIDNPCEAGSVCIDVVCRKLCFPGERVCEIGEICMPLASRADIATCRAD